MTRCARLLGPAVMAAALVVGWQAPAHAVIVDGTFDGFVVSGYGSSPFSPSNVSGVVHYDTNQATVLAQSFANGLFVGAKYGFMAPGSALLSAVYKNPTTGAVIGSVAVGAPFIRIGILGGLDERGHPNPTGFTVTGDMPGLLIRFSTHDFSSGDLILPDGNLPTASFPIPVDTEFNATDYSDQQHVIKIPPAIIFGEMTLTAVPEPRAPLVVFGGALLILLWRRHRSTRQLGLRWAATIPPVRA